MKTPAAVAWMPNQPLAIEELELRGPADDELVIEIIGTSICSSDLLALSGLDPNVRFPVVLGHEAAGIVRAAGARCGLHVGDHVIPCLRDDKLKKRNRRARQFRIGQLPLENYPGYSTFAQFIVLAENSVSKIRQDAPLDRVCAVSCGIAPGIGAAIDIAGIRPGAKVVVFGLTAVGLGIIQGARIAGAETIIGVDLNSSRKNVAQKLGLTHYVNPNTIGSASVTRVLKEITRVGADFSFDCLGTDESATHSRTCVKRRAQAVVLSLACGSGRSWNIIERPNTRLERVKKAELNGLFNLSRLVDWYMDGKIYVDDLITATMPFSKINEAIRLERSQDTIRTVLKF
jgi:S-(hydroxymethyl)glutathione dehydrogenase / alcohol dehydrogenase